MDWIQLAQLIIQVGLPVAEQIWKNATSGKEPTQADWDVLMALSAETPKSRILAAAARAGLAPDDPKVLALLAAIQ